jgi:hypothetical protein
MLGWFCPEQSSKLDSTNAGAYSLNSIRNR